MKYSENQTRLLKRMREIKVVNLLEFFGFIQEAKIEACALIQDDLIRKVNRHRYRYSLSEKGEQFCLENNF